MKSIYVQNKKGTKVNLTVGRNYIIIHRNTDGIQVETSGEILNINNDTIDFGDKIVKVDSIEDINDITER